MGFFSDKHIIAMRTGIYPCDKCDGTMVFEDESEETLICTKCGYEVYIDDYGFTEEELENRYPTREEVTGEYEDDFDEDNPWGDTYDEVYNELDDD